MRTWFRKYYWLSISSAVCDPSRPLGPWTAALVRNKLIGSLRRRGRQAGVPLDDVIATLESDDGVGVADRMDLEPILSRLEDPQRTIVQSISIGGSSIRPRGRRSMATIASNAHVYLNTNKAFRY